ncbi:MarR family transcriptional regulator [Haloterrigena sp. SYSU A558-1]|uniref:MarR family transcriptional regulator n=1 Tax=Haloterrigena gelatinilytica TaxID=2741724 RepID=A0A8J8GQ38_9EURY|nr:MarR family transcriptional regulator [Haloterrigena gelatinilytica]NUB93946.1 MarR family transcriptional regulator [Haloterrigena gelatinilytica]NUC74872.1 MarR family transcriptional regulator [Haloterrigena gelatinilytica]
MSSQKQRPEPRIEPIPEELDSAQAKLVFLCLEATGGATVDDLGDLLAMKKLSILSLLNELSSENLIERRGEEYVVAN